MWLSEALLATNSGLHLMPGAVVTPTMAHRPLNAARASLSAASGLRPGAGRVSSIPQN
ncbi:hypothetical protein PSP20601_05052 [Pandoraea sputorum]|nr:hypothetical protein PSP20601_05052 [Pandoraea sputorum]